MTPTTPKLTKRLRAVLLRSSSFHADELRRALSCCLERKRKDGDDRTVMHLTDPHIAKLRSKIDEIEKARTALEALP